MTKEEYLEYWKSMSHSELMVRCGLYIDRIAELERQAEKRETELIRQVDCVIDLQSQLRAAQWAPARHRETIGDERWPQTVWLVIQEHGFSFCTPYSTDHIRLPEGYALCRKVQP